MEAFAADGAGARCCLDCIVMQVQLSDGKWGVLGSVPPAMHELEHHVRRHALEGVTANRCARACAQVGGASNWHGTAICTALCQTCPVIVRAQGAVTWDSIFIFIQPDRLAQLELFRVGLDTCAALDFLALPSC